MARTSFFLSAAAAALALGITAANSAQAGPHPLAAPAAQGGNAAGEKILNANCQDCHDLRVVQTQAKDVEGWTKTIENMLAMGAEVPKDDIPVLITYLARNHGPVPDGPGKEILLNICTMCHDLGRIKTGRRSSEEWEETLGSMLNEGAPLNDEQFAVIHAYLSKHFNAD